MDIVDKADSGVELGSFLRAMRERLTPEAAGLPGSGKRRTPGLRRQEVAELAAVSIDWYIRLEQGRVGTPGAAVLDAIAIALQLSDSERAHLHLIARGAQPPSRSAPAPLSPTMQAILDGMPLLPAYAMDFRYDVLARNAAAAALFGEDFGPGLNTARLIFLDPVTLAGQLDWPQVARETVGNLRRTLARHPDDTGLRTLIDELRTASPEFAAWWNDHDVHDRRHGRKRISHPRHGVLTVHYDTFISPDGSDHCLFVLTPADPTTETALATLITDRAQRLGTRSLRPTAS